MVNIGDIVRTTQFPHNHRNKIRVLKMLEGKHLVGKQEQIMVACVDLDDGTRMNLLYRHLYKIDGDLSEQELKFLALRGDKKATAEYIRKYKKLPKR